MKTVEQIKKKLIVIQNSKCHALKDGSDIGYVSSCKMEKLLKWVLGDDYHPRGWNNKKKSNGCTHDYHEKPNYFICKKCGDKEFKL